MTTRQQYPPAEKSEARGTSDPLPAVEISPRGPGGKTPAPDCGSEHQRRHAKCGPRNGLSHKEERAVQRRRAAAGGPATVGQAHAPSRGRRARRLRLTTPTVATATPRRRA